MPTQVAPGVYTKIIDQSIFATPIPGTTGFIPILSKKGEDNTLIFVGSQGALVNTFGAPNISKYGQALYNAFNFLTYSSNLYVIRPLPTVEDTAELIESGTLTPPLTAYTPWVNKPATFAAAVLTLVNLKDIDMLNMRLDPNVILDSYTTVLDVTQTNFNLNITPLFYTVGRQELRVYVDGEPYTDYTEVGISNTQSSIIHITGTIEAGSRIYVYKVNYNYASMYAIANPHDRPTLVPRFPDPMADPQNVFTVTDDQIYLSTPVTEETLPPIGIYTPFRFVPGQKQLTVTLMSPGRGTTPLILGTDYKEMVGGNGIILLRTLQANEYVKIEKKGIVFATRYREKFIDPVTDTTVDHNLRTILDYRYTLRQIPATKDWLANYWTYNNISLTNSEVPVPCITEPLIIFASKGRGSYYNDLSIKIRPILNMDKHYEIRVSATEPLFNTTTDLEVFTVSFVPGTVDGTGLSTFVEDVLNKYSAYIKCYCNIDRLNQLANTIDPVLTYARNGVETTYYDHTAGTPQTVLDRLLSTLAYVDITINSSDFAFSIPLRGGSEGCLLREDNSINVAVMTKCIIAALKGLYDIRVIDTEDNDISLVFDAGFPKAVKDAIIELCLSRGDCFAVLDLDKCISVNQAVQTRNTTLAYNTYIAGLYAPHTKVYSFFEGKVITVAPSYFMASVIPYSDMVGELWFAPAGPQRGTIPAPEKLLFNAFGGDLDILYMNQINPIIYKNKRYMVYGQLTTQRKSSALSDINIVRLVLYLRKRLERTLSEFIFEQNDAFTWAQARRAAEGVLAEIATRRGLYEYAVEVGANEYEIRAKSFHVNVIIKPTRTTEKILLNIIVR